MKPVTPAMIKELRERTGIGMGKCKEALEEARGDMELAISNLRKSGMASAVKKEGRETREGMIAVGENAQAVVLIEGNAETDFVVKNERFQAFLSSLIEEALAHLPASLEAFLQQKYSKDPALTIDQYRATVVQAIGENIQIKRILVVPKQKGHSYGIYSHLGGKIVTLVDLSGSDQEAQLGKEIGMHIAAAAPEFLAPEEIPAHLIENEKEIARAQIQGKPANIVDKIIEGKLNAYYDGACLLRQKYIRDDSLTIADLVKKQGKDKGAPSLSLVRFVRWSIG